MTDKILIIKCPSPDYVNNGKIRLTLDEVNCAAIYLKQELDNLDGTRKRHKTAARPKNWSLCSRIQLGYELQRSHETRIAFCCTTNEYVVMKLLACRKITQHKTTGILWESRNKTMEPVIAKEFFCTSNYLLT